MDSPWKQEMESAGTEFFSPLSMVLPGKNFMLYEYFFTRLFKAFAFYRPVIAFLETFCSVSLGVDFGCLK